MSNQNTLLLNNLLKFYNKKNLESILSIINGESKISLRIIDWFVTNYSKKNFTIYQLNNNNRFKVYTDYKLKLKAYSKKRFDPFCRKDRVYNWGPEENITTTIGQLNFFKWAIENNIIKYIKENLASIESDMNENVRKHHKTKKKDKLANCGKTKRKELSTNASKSVQKLSNTIVLDFD